MDCALEGRKSPQANTSNGRQITGRYLTVVEAADYLRVSRHTIYAWTKKLTIPHIKMNRKVSFDRHDLDKWMDERKVSSI